MRLLIIEDEEDLRKAIVLAMTDEGYATDSAEDGEVGLYKALNWDYDAIILDIMMPELDGWEVLRRLRQKKRTPVLILTARDSLEDCVKGLDLGSDDFMVKPFSPTELCARIRALIRRSTRHGTNVLQFEDLKVDMGSKRVAVSGKTIKLTALEYSLVEYMMNHLNKVISRTELYEHLFDENADSLSNVLDVHVCNARRKLGGAYIQTRRGQGYIIGRD